MLKGHQEKMIMVGVTGTKGKSTVVSILSFVLSKLDVKFASHSTMEV
jgi:UDP-N-acetylmuramoylalanine-D-glutamate ligase